MQRPPASLTDDGPDAPIELDDNGKLFLQLFHEEEQRRKTRLQKPWVRSPGQDGGEEGILH